MSSNRLERQGSPTGLRRLLFRAPIPLYRAGLGFLLGKRFLMLEHVGRKSGDTRRTVLEVVVNDTDAAYVAAAWGSRAQWLKNVRSNPHVTFYLAARRYRTTCHEVSVETRHELMDRYAREHPRALFRLAAFMFDDPGQTSEEQASQVAATIPMVRLPKNG